MAESRTAEAPGDTTAQVLQAAVADTSIPRTYANGFALGLTNADITIVLQRNGQPVTVLNLSYTLAKTLAQRVGRLVAELEERIGNPLVTTEKIDELFKAASEPHDSSSRR